MDFLNAILFLGTYWDTIYRIFKALVQGNY